MKLYEYQKELLNSEGKNILVNWCRRAGKDTGIAMYILKKKPTNVLYLGYEFQFNNRLIKVIKALEETYNFSIESTKDNRAYSITFLDTNDEIKIITSETNPLGFTEFDLVIDDRWYPNNNDLSYKKYIWMTNSNINKISDYCKMFEQLITVDHRRMLKSIPEEIDNVINSVRKSNRFFDEYALIDEKDTESMTFQDFQFKALGKLMKQFMDTPDTKDTVLTRKNIIDMIKDLKELRD